MDFCKYLLILVKLVLHLVSNTLYIAVQSVKVDLRYIGCISYLRSKGVVPVVLGSYYALNNLQQAISYWVALYARQYLEDALVRNDRILQNFEETLEVRECVLA